MTCFRGSCVADLTEWSPSTPEDPGSNPVIGNIIKRVFAVKTKI